MTAERDPALRGGHGRRLVVFSNPAAGGPQRTALETALATLRDFGVHVRCEQPADGEALCEAIRGCAADADAAVVAGGDGTVNAALPALLESRLILGLLPLGTANDLARTLAIPEDPEAAARVLAEGRVRRLDLGRVNGRLFCNVAHVGFGVRVQAGGLGPRQKRLLRALVYPLSLLRGIARLRAFGVEVTVDGCRWQMPALHFSVGNGRFYGGGVPVHEQAAIDDGLLDAYCVPPQRGLDVLRAIRDVWRGGLPGSPVWRASGREVRLCTRRPRRIMADGEYIARTPATYEVLPGVLQALVPAAADAPGLADTPSPEE